jgi:alpha-galactosidase
MADNGLLAAGYEYLQIDDCWHAAARDKDDRLTHDVKKFPHGMKAVGDYVHARGLKFGMYTSIGPYTCQGLPGSLDHEFLDAQTFASWGVDYLKCDNCTTTSYMLKHLYYKRMGFALATCGRDILFGGGLCEEDASWIKTTGAHLWRSGLDIHDCWSEVKSIHDMQYALQPYAAQGSFNDVDMLVTGMRGKGFCSLGGCTQEEYRTQFSLWAILNAPLILSLDVRRLTPADKEILLNRDVIAINQDIGVRQPYPADARPLHKGDPYPDNTVWCKHLDGGDVAICFVNLTDSATIRWMVFDSIGLGGVTQKALLLKNLWTGEDLGVRRDGYSVSLPAHGCLLLRGKIVDRAR